MGRFLIFDALPVFFLLILRILCLTAAIETWFDHQIMVFIYTSNQIICRYFESYISFIKFVYTFFRIKSSQICWNNMNRRQTCWYTNLLSIQKWIRKIWLVFEFRWKFILVRFCRFLMLLLDNTKTKTHIHRETHNHGTKIHTYLLNIHTHCWLTKLGYSWMNYYGFAHRCICRWTGIWIGRSKSLVFIMVLI